jgi:hypothetical protein
MAESCVRRPSPLSWRFPAARYPESRPWKSEASAPLNTGIFRIGLRRCSGQNPFRGHSGLTRPTPVYWQRGRNSVVRTNKSRKPSRSGVRRRMSWLVAAASGSGGQRVRRNNPVSTTDGPTAV